MSEKIHDFNEAMKNESTESGKGNLAGGAYQYQEDSTNENMTVFTCLIDMIALEEGVFGSGTSTSRIARAHRNLKNGLRLKDGSIFRYTHATGPSLDDYTVKVIQAKDDADTQQETKIKTAII